MAFDVDENNLGLITAQGGSIAGLSLLSSPFNMKQAEIVQRSAGLLKGRVGNQSSERTLPSCQRVRDLAKEMSMPGSQLDVFVFETAIWCGERCGALENCRAALGQGDIKQQICARLG